MQDQAVSKKLDENIAWWKQQFSDCADIKMCPMCLGRDMNIRAFLSYIEVTGGKNMMEDSVLGKMLNRLDTMEPQQVYEALQENGLGVSDATPFAQMSEAAGGMLTGDSILFVDGFDRALKIPDKGYPGMSLQETESEKAIRGSNEGFGGFIKQNTALIRKRLRSVDLKVAECKCGRRTGTNVDVMYLDGIVRPQVVTEMQQRLAEFDIDGIGDSGVIEQLTETQWFSPFPQYQTTRRPDRAVMALLEGRAVLLADNSPEALIFPTDYNSFIKTTDDYYTRWEIATFTRTLRYVAAFLSMILPGLYLAMTNFHTQLLPTKLLLSFAAARQGVPFPGVVEVLLMELSFELLREAGVRLPGAMGNTIGIVGGLIIGQAAVDANIVSPMVVIVVAFTALCSFAIPNEDFATAFRLLKFAFIGLSAALGFYGFLLGLLILLIHLAQLENFGMPYLMPFVGADLNDYQDERDTFVRPPLQTLTHRPFYADPKNRVRLRMKHKNR
ncbi:spore germination protein [uncultured Eubacterium sp.]|uniref:spore germination protein n=1 Tax=uncultured Eubacterium sp. TaxID=165185 RepID=UPI0025CFB921|nr:spore germination protein [uncultured Eubacterium sp.]MCI6536937.1 spore germination protein [Lachnospiraceae bacterium]